VSLFGWLTGGSVSAAEVRAEVWKLGVRHRGEPLRGALRELDACAVFSHRAALLRACVQHIRRA